MILVPLVGTLAGSPWLVVFLMAALAVSWFALLAILLAYDPRDLWM
jgi:hypothetical protein